LSNSTNVTASALAMRAGGKIGSSDTNAASNTNCNAIGTRVATLAAQSATGSYIQEADGVTIDSVNVSVNRVNFNSTKTAQSQTLEDLTTTNNGPVKLQSLTGDIVVNAGTAGTSGISAHGTGDVLLQTLSGGITSNATIASGTGNITLDASGAITANSGIQTGGSGTVYLSSGASTTINSVSTVAGDVQLLSGGTLTLGSINAGAGRVYLQATNDIQDSDSLSNSTNVTASALAMRAGGKIGSSDTGAASSTNRNAIGTRVTTLAAESAGIYVQEADGVTIDLVNVSVDRVNFNSTKTTQSQTLEDLTTTNNGPVKLQSIAGDLVVNSGTTGTNGITANGSGDVLLQALEGSITSNAVIASGTGNITLDASGALMANAAIQT
ncbi:MAG: hypothetical protein ACKOAH_28845, partial [Pirellula sp.]